MYDDTMCMIFSDGDVDDDDCPIYNKMCPDGSCTPPLSKCGKTTMMLLLFPMRRIMPLFKIFLFIQHNYRCDKTFRYILIGCW